MKEGPYEFSYSIQCINCADDIVVIYIHAPEVTKCIWHNCNDSTDCFTLYFYGKFRVYFFGHYVAIRLPWLPSLDINIDFRLDGLSLFFSLLISLIGWQYFIMLHAICLKIMMIYPVFIYIYYYS